MPDVYELALFVREPMTPASCSSGSTPLDTAGKRSLGTCLRLDDYHLGARLGALHACEKARQQHIQLTVCHSASLSSDFCVPTNLLVYAFECSPVGRYMYQCVWVRRLGLLGSGWGWVDVRSGFGSGWAGVGSTLGLRLIGNEVVARGWACT